MDLKIEIRKLLALHEATIRLDHGIKAATSSDWMAFAPSRFVYAFFTFNSIYSYDWKASFTFKKAVRWEKGDDGRFPSEEQQFGSYVRFVDTVFAPDTGAIYSAAFNRTVVTLRPSASTRELENIRLENASKQLKGLAKKLPAHVGYIEKGRIKDFDSTARLILKFVYGVRCNLFHGRKTKVDMLDESQQRRLAVYTALLIALNSMLFQIAHRKRADIGWDKVTIDF